MSVLKIQYLHILGFRYRKCTLTFPTSSRTGTVTLLGAWCDCLANKRGLLYGTDLISFKSILDYCFCVYFGTATYVDYLMFSHLNLITNPTPRPNATLTIGATARNPNYQGSHVYPNYRGSCTQP